LLNAAPDTTGLIPSEDMALYRQFGDEINRWFGKSIASTSGKGEIIEVKFEKTTKIDHVIIQEDIIFGERVREYIIDGHVNGSWKEIAKGISVGYKRIEKFDTVEVNAVRVRFTRFSYLPVIKDFSVYYVGNNSTSQTRIANERFLLETEVDKSGKFEIDLSDFIKTAGQYELTIITEGKDNIKILSSKLILQGIETSGFTRINENGTLNINITAHPSGGKGTIRLSGQLIFEKNKTKGKVTFYLSEK
jgi:alpha-L-fucosidase